MKSYRKELWFNVPSRRGFVNITPQVEEAVRESSVQEGLVLVNASLSHFRHQAFWQLVAYEFRPKFPQPDIQF